MQPSCEEEAMEMEQAAADEAATAEAEFYEAMAEENTALGDEAHPDEIKAIPASAVMVPIRYPEGECPASDRTA